jgi:tight adherence protein B
MMDPLVIAISALILLTFVTFAAAFSGKRGESKAFASRLQKFKGEQVDSPSVEPTEESSAFKHRTYSGVPILSSFFANMKGSEAVAIQLEQAAIPLRVGEFYMIRWSAAAILFFVPFVFGFSIFNFLIAIGLSVVGYMIPAQWVNSRRKKRINHINAQLVDLLGMVSNSLKSGYGLMQSFEFAARQLPDPLGHEIQRMLRESTLGVSAEQALNALGKRVDSRDLDMVLTAINIQRSVGGNLAEILDKVAYTMRERERIRGEINTLTAQQKLTGIVIGGLPVFMFIIFMVVNPDYMATLFTTTAGRLLIVVGLSLEVVGYFAIKRIMAIEI